MEFLLLWQLLLFLLFLSTINPTICSTFFTADGVVNFWEIKSELSHGGVLKGHKVAVLCLAAAGNMVYSGSADDTICVWRREGAIHTCLSLLTDHTGPVKCLAVEEDQESSKNDDKRWILYSGSLDKSVKVWSVSETTADSNRMAMMKPPNTASDLESLPSEGSFSSVSRASQNKTH